MNRAASVFLFTIILLALPAAAAGLKPLLIIGYTASNHGETDPCG